MQRENDVDELDHMKAKISLEKWKHSTYVAENFRFKSQK